MFVNQVVLMAADGPFANIPNPSSLQIFASEFFGTMILLMFGAGTCCTNNLLKSKGQGGGWLMINFGWGLAVYMGVYAAWITGGHLNPAVTAMKAVWHAFDPNVTLNGQAVGAGGIAVTSANIMIYVAAQFLGAFVGAALAYLAYKKQFDQKMEDNRMKLFCFSTAPEVRSPLWNTVTEIVGTFALMTFIMVSGGTPSQVGPLAVALCIVVIGIALGGPTGYAINPARDLAPRVFHEIMPSTGGKTDSDWGYAWVPVVAPMIGAVITPLLVIAVGMNV